MEKSQENSDQEKRFERQQQKGLQRQVSEIAYDQSYSRSCQHCGDGVSDTADICENCHSWLLDGQCCFCYTPFESHQKFCSECGNNPTGIECTSCGYHSIFDYCPKCNTCLTEQAEETIQYIENSEEFLAIIQLHNSIENLLSLGAGDDEVAIEKKKLQVRIEGWNEFQRKVEEQNRGTRKQRRDPSGGNTGRFDIEDGIKASQQSTDEKNRSEQKIAKAKELLRQAEAESIKRIAELQQHEFKDNQSARRYQNSLQLLMPKLVPKTKKIKRKSGWLCNYANYFHVEGPHDCGDPSKGGTWIYELDNVDDGFSVTFE